MRVQCARHVGGFPDDCGWGQVVADATPRYAADTLCGRCPECGAKTEAVTEARPRITPGSMPFCLGEVIYYYQSGDMCLETRKGEYRYTLDGHRTWSDWRSLYAAPPRKIQILFDLANIAGWRHISPGVDYRDMLGFEGDDT